MKTPLGELIDQIESSQRIDILRNWLEKNKKRLLEQEHLLLLEVSIHSQKDYINAESCYPPQFAVDKAKRVVSDIEGL